MPPFSYIDHLECTICGAASDYDGLATVSECCGKVLFVRYDLARLGREVSRGDYDSRASTMWRFNELLPVTNPDSVITLGEGGTPLLDATTLAQQVGIRRLWIKEEGLNPTGTFKARGISAAVSKACELGSDRVHNAVGGECRRGRRGLLRPRRNPGQGVHATGCPGFQQKRIHRRRFRA